MTKPTFPIEMLAQHLAIVGKAGSGKTYAAKGFVEHLLREQRRVCILDPTGVWWGLRSSLDGKREGFPVAVFGGAHADVPVATTSGAALAHLVATKNLPAIVDLSEMLIGERHRFVTDFAEALYRDNRQPLHLVIDEADEFVPQQPLPETKRMLHHVDRIVRRGRVRGFRVMLITQRPAVINKNVLTQANTLVAMRLTGPQDRLAVKAWVDGTGNPAHGKMVIDSLAKLQRGEGWVWAPELEVLSRVPFPAITTFDSSRSPEDGEDVIEPSKLAAVDLMEIRESFAAVESEAQNLKQARAEIAQLRGEVERLDAAMKLQAAPAYPDLREDLQQAQAQLRETEAQLGHARAIVTQIQQIVEGTRLSFEPGVTKVATWQRRAPAPEILVAPPAGRPAADLQVTRKPAGASKNGRSTSTPKPVVEGVTTPMQRILDVLRQLEQYGVAPVERPMLAAHSGVSPTSGGFFNNLGRLRTMGMIDYPSGGQVALTDGGRQVANPPATRLTLNDLHDSWLSIVPQPQARILAELIPLYPKAIARDDLAKRIGVSPTSGGFFNNLGRLRTLGAIDYPAKGTAAASPILFPRGLR